jgi:peptide/nickel transport system substrate-binding protein
VSSNSYWAGLLGQRASRRSVIVGGAGLAGAAALLAACGGDSDSGKEAGGAAKIFSDDKAETPVKTGGTYKKYLAADPANLDLYRQTAASPKHDFGNYALNRLVKFKVGPGVRPYQPIGDLADGWEISNGGLTYTFKMRQGVKYHNVAPVNGRLFDSEDVIASYKRFSVGVGEAAVSGNKGGSPLFGGFSTIDTVSAPDKQTVVFNLKQPNSAFLTTVAAVDNGFFIFPKEADVSYDPNKTLIGTGPWILSNYVPSVRLEYTRNPEYYEKGLPYMDGTVVYFIPEAAQQLAQFKAGSIFHFTPVIFEDFQALITELPSLRILQSAFGSTEGINFGREDPEGPFIKDVRVRRALSIAIDRTTMMEEFNDVQKFKRIGIDRPYRLGTFIPAYLDDYYIDPRGKEMGENAEWFQFDPQKAKQLVVAAGYPNGFEFAQRYASRNTGYSLNVHPILQEEWAVAGMHSKITPEDYDSIFNARSWRGQCTGVAIHGPQNFPDPAQQIDFLFGPTGTRNAMAVNDPILNAMQDRNLAELDVTKRRAIVVEELQYLAGVMRHVPYGWSSANSFALHHPQVRNNWAYRTFDSATATGASGGANTIHWWLAS